MNKNNKTKFRMLSIRTEEDEFIFSYIKFFYVILLCKYKIYQKEKKLLK